LLVVFVMSNILLLLVVVAAVVLGTMTHLGRMTKVKVEAVVVLAGIAQQH